MRLCVLAEHAEAWRRTLGLLAGLARRHHGERGPSRSDLYLFFQTLVAIWAGSDRGTLADRMAEYMQKAAREAKRDTSWLNPDAEYEAALDRL